MSNEEMTTNELYKKLCENAYTKDRSKFYETIENLKTVFGIHGGITIELPSIEDKNIKFQVNSNVMFTALVEQTLKRQEKCRNANAVRNFMQSVEQFRKHINDLDRL